MRESSPRLILREKAVAEMQRSFLRGKIRESGEKVENSAVGLKPLPLGATATTAASGGNREELLGQRPAGCKRQRSRRWVPQPGLWHCEAMTERARMLPRNRRRGDRIALTKGLLLAARRLCRGWLALSGALRQLSQRESRRRRGCVSLSLFVNLWKMHGLDRDNL